MATPSGKQRPSSGDLPSAAKMSFGIVRAQWNREVTKALEKGCMEVLSEAGVKKEAVYKHVVPGSFELPLGAQWLAQQHSPDAVICLGCIIKGETDHDVYIAQAVAGGLTELNLKFNRPFIFGVLTTHSLQQAKARAGGKKGNKGSEAAASAVQMVALRQKASNR